MKIKAVIFDKDGVLIDTEKFNVESAVLSFKDQGIDLDEEDKEIIKGRHPHDYQEVLAKKHKFNPEKIRAGKSAYYWKLYENAKLFPGALKLLSALKQRQLKLALVTSSSISSTKKFIDGFNLFFFDVQVNFEDCQQRKPAPDCYLVAARKLNLSPTDCLVIEDSVIGVKAAKAAGMKCVAVTNTFPKERLTAADYIIDSLDQFEMKWLQ